MTGKPARWSSRHQDVSCLSVSRSRSTPGRGETRSRSWRRHASSRRRSSRADSSTAESSSTERTWHLAAAAQGEDERIASSLETVALDARGRGAQAVASKAFEHAARLSPEVEARARRLHEAGADAYLAGE